MSEIESPSLNINDLLGAVKIIDACSERGAFRGNELANVGAVRDRLEAFAQDNMPAEPEPEQEEEAQTEEKDEE